MNQYARDKVELGTRVAGALLADNGDHPKLLEMRIRHRATHAQQLAEIDRTYGEVYGA